MKLNNYEIAFAKDFKFNFKNLNSDTITINLDNLAPNLVGFISELDEGQIYWITLDFYPTLYAYKHELGIKMNLSKPILVSIDSNPYLLADYIKNQLNAMIELYYLDDSIIQGDEPCIIIEYFEIEFN